MEWSAWAPLYPKGLIGWIPRALVIAAAAAAAWHAVRLARADHEFRKLTRAGLDGAVGLDPGNSLYLTTLAQLADPAPLLRRAAAASPYDSGVRIRLGLQAESEGDHAEAERRLLEAARLNRQYEPRWTLANFYFRRDNQAEFRRWAREALVMSYGDRAPLFDLCAAVAGDLGEVARWLPDQDEVRIAFGQYAAARGRAKEIAPLIESVVARGAATSGVTTELCRALMNEYAVPAALRCSARVGGEGAFPWRWPEVRGVAVSRRSDGGLRITLDGTQPEAIELLSRIVPIAGGRCRLDVSWDGPTAGLQWILERHAPDGGVLPHVFDAPAFSAARLTLRYRRPSGTVRQEAVIDVLRAGVACTK
jgi:hypothetical protein